MSEATAVRDYSLVGAERERAVAAGLHDADWYRCSVDRATMKQLVQRRNGPAVWGLVLWVAILGTLGAAGVLTWGSWWAVPAFFVYGTAYGSLCDARWHECGHGTAFRSGWLNTAVYHAASFMATREPISWRWSHTRHHSDTIIVGLDPEIAYPRPTPTWKIVAEMFNLISFPRELRKMLTNLVGQVTDSEREYLPESEWPKAILAARIHLLLYASVVATAVLTQSWLPLALAVGPSFYGRWLLVVYGTTQHAGLAEDVLDHRLNSRTILMNPVNRFCYLNMNYHCEHHMFPNVPFHALPALHDAVRHDMPAPYRGLLGAYREIIPALRRQRRDPSHFVVRALPQGPK